MDGCKACGFAYSFVFQVQFHAKDCPENRSGVLTPLPYTSHAASGAPKKN